jgi:hypothetical protein
MRSTTAAFHGHCLLGSRMAHSSLPGRRSFSRHHMPEEMGREVRGNVGREAGIEELAESQQGALAETGVRVRAQHLKAKGTLRHATVKALLEK